MNISEELILFRIVSAVDLHAGPYVVIMAKDLTIFKFR
jgi:hypothetical protein